MATRVAEPPNLTEISLVVIAAVAIAAAIAYTRTVMVPFVLAVFISYAVSPLVDLAQDRFRIPRAVSIIFALAVAIGLLTLLVLLISTSTERILASANIYRDRLASIAQKVFAVLDRLGIDLGQQPLLRGLEELPLASMVRGTAGTVVGLLTTGGLVAIFVVYLLAGRRPAELRTGFYAEIDAKVQRYIVTKVAVSATTGTLVGLILWLFGLELALVFGVAAFLLNFIPSVGSIVATLLPLPIALIQYESIWPIIGVLALPGAVQITIGNGVEPILLGESLDLHPVVVLLALIFWGMLWGVVGMLLAAPITAILRIVLARIETTRPVAEILAGRLPAGRVTSSQ